MLLFCCTKGSQTTRGCRTLSPTEFQSSGMSTISDRHETVDGIKSTFVAGIREQGAARARKDIDRLSIDFADTIRRDIVGMGSVVHVAVVQQRRSVWRHPCFLQSRKFMKIKTRHASPVLPNPPAPLSVSSTLSTAKTSGVTMRSSTSCATRSPCFTMKSSSAWLNRTTPTSPL